jgi:hypothetical protein
LPLFTANLLLLWSHPESNRDQSLRRRTYYPIILWDQHKKNYRILYRTCKGAIIFLLLLLLFVFAPVLQANPLVLAVLLFVLGLGRLAEGI